MALTAPIEPNEISFTGNPIRLVLSTSIPSEFISLKLYISTVAGTGTISTEFFLEPDVNNQAETDLSQLIANFMDSDEVWPLPLFPSVVIPTMNQRVVRYWYTAEEIVGGIPNGNKYEVLEANALTAVLGGIGHQVYPLAGFWVEMMNNAIPEYPFLAHRPVHVPARIGIAEFLPYFMLAADVSAKLQIQITYDDASTTMIEKWDPTPLVKNSMYQIPAGYDDLKLSVYDFPNVAKYITKWVVQLVKVLDDSPLSEGYPFTLSRKYVGDLRHFIFYGSLGGFESIAVFGDFKTQTQIKGQAVNKYMGPGYIETFPQRVARNRYEQQSTKATSGFVPDGTVDWLRDFLTSPQIYQVVDRPGVPGGSPKLLIPVEIKQAKFKLNDETKQVQDLQFEFLPLFTDNHPPIKMIDTVWSR
jgi:hypothetical protein